ncbi:hypothetical protein L228DRAFT_209787 [Xylona heveae TC161]|uniref:FHA domain-containing protein n=1 Tax=Xylona heveae (strain CBS 132557 / TC161) TaxID=1328760 RepID=A0A165HE05_XYLHT|nr:hypothetical protein L228DRAFT_209787 [Xylona heveae TC161]KZF23366.1 hypothetical protein L228DRAFT_209787 [Xylona heveae TC161]
MESLSNEGKKKSTSILGVKRPASTPSLLPAFELLSSSPPCVRPAKRVSRVSGSKQDAGLSKYPTPLPSSSLGNIPSSPPALPKHPDIQRTTSSFSERSPLRAVTTIPLPETEETILLGRSSNSSTFQLSANRLISRVHVRATYVAARSPQEQNKVVIQCVGWNGVKVHCQGRTWDLSKGDTFTSSTHGAEIMLDVQDARVLIAWPRTERKGSLDSDSTWEDESFFQRPLTAIPGYDGSSLVRSNQRLRSPISPTPASRAQFPSSSTFIPSDPPVHNTVEVYEDVHSSDEGNDKAQSNDDQHRPSGEIVDSFQSIGAESRSSSFNDLHDFSDRDEENDPIVHSFGPFGDNLLPRMASFTTGDSPRRSATESNRAASPLKESETQEGKKYEKEDTDAISNHAINQLAFSRLASTPLSAIVRNLPSTLKGDSSGATGTLSKDCLRKILEGTSCIGEVTREGKDAAGKPLESEYYYIPELDADEKRREAVVNSLRKPLLRNCRKQHKFLHIGELRNLNVKAWAGEQDVFPVSGSLDSSLKKNTAFIKRLRTAISAPTLPTFLQEIRTLSLHKYLSEIISACYEGLCKLKSPGEVAAGVEIVSALHQRFGPKDFTSYLGWFLGRGLSTPDKAQLKALGQEAREKEEKDRLGRQRVLLRVVTELWLLGVLKSLDDVTRPDEAGRPKDAAASSKTADGSGRSKSTQTGPRSAGTEAEPFPLEVLKDLLGHDREHANLPLVVLFVKNFGWDILGIRSTAADGRKSVEEDGATSGPVADLNESAVADNATNTEAANDDDSPLASPEMRQRFKNILIRYFDDVKAHLIREQNSLSAQGRRNAEAYVKSGEVFEDRQSNFDKQSKAFEKLVSNAQILCDALGADMPLLRENENLDTGSTSGIGLVKTGEYLRGQSEGAGIWEDEEERRFYENLIDLKDRVPGILLEDSKKKKPDGNEQVGRKNDAGAIAGDSVDNQEKTTNGAGSQEAETKTPEIDDQSTSIANKTVGAQVDALLARLPELTGKDAVDETAIDFCFLNSKASRNRLVKAVQELPKGRMDLLPLYSRLVATLGKYMPDVSQGLVSYLDEEYRSLQRRKQKDFLGQVRMNNVRYLAELTKFGVVPEHVIFHCFKVSLDDFSRMNLEIIGNLLENCGRYLLRNPETSPRMSSFLETLQRKKAAQHLGQQERMLLENAIYYVNPPERAAIQQKERTPLELFVRKIIYLDMNKRNYTKVLKQIRKLHWEEEEVVGMLSKIFSRPGKVKYSNIHLLAILVGALYRYHQEFVITAVDDLLESITIGLEQNEFKYNQRRIAEVKYLGELYNYKVIDSPVIFDTLYRIVTFGHEGGTPVPGRFCALDMPDDFFRIRLVCTILDTCGVCFDRSTARKKLDFFLKFFQYYLYTKDPLPMDVEFIVQDTFALTRPQWKLVTNLEEAGRLFAEAVAQNYKLQDTEKPLEPEEPDDSSSSDDGFDEDEDRMAENEEGPSSGEEMERSADAEIEIPDTGSDDEDIVVTRQDGERDPEAEAEFDRELAKMMSESLDSRKFDRKQVFDVPLPMRRQIREPGSADDSSTTGRDTPPNTMAFALLTKKGNRQQTKTVELPSDSHFAVAMKTQQQAEREEQQRIKNLVLNYDLGEDNDGDEKINTFSPSQYRFDKASNNRSTQRARKLQLSDVDWYELCNLKRMLSF